VAAGINALGQSEGGYEAADGSSHAFLRDPDDDD
jgi:hypothetical protein